LDSHADFGYFPISNTTNARKPQANNNAHDPHNRGNGGRESQFYMHCHTLPSPPSTLLLLWLLCHQQPEQCQQIIIASQQQ